MVSTRSGLVTNPLGPSHDLSTSQQAPLGPTVHTPPGNSREGGMDRLPDQSSLNPQYRTSPQDSQESHYNTPPQDSQESHYNSQESPDYETQENDEDFECHTPLPKPHDYHTPLPKAHDYHGPKPNYWVSDYNTPQPNYQELTWQLKTEEAKLRQRQTRTPTPAKLRFDNITKPCAGDLLNTSNDSDDGTAIQNYEIETALCDTIKKKIIEHYSDMINMIIKSILLITTIVLLIFIIKRESEPTQHNITETLSLFTDLEKTSILDKVRLKEIKNNIIYKIVDPQKDDPLTIFILVTAEKRRIVEEEVQTIAHIFNKAISRPAQLKTISENTWSNNVEYDEGLDQDLKSNIYSVLVSDFNLFSWAKAKLFYQFCDNDNAPYNNKLFAFLVNVENCVVGKEVGQIVDILEKRWVNEKEADIPALVSRISAVSICVV